MESVTKKFKTIVNVVCEGVFENIDPRDIDYHSAENYYSIQKIDLNGKDAITLLGQHPEILSQANKYFEYGKYEVEVELVLDIKEVRQVTNSGVKKVTNYYYYYNGKLINSYLNEDDMWTLEELFKNYMPLANAS
jgi:hypothetical protein